jgi:hypothetical protein
MIHLVFCLYQEPGNLKKIYSHLIGEFDVLAYSVHVAEKRYTVLQILDVRKRDVNVTDPSEGLIFCPAK